ncbi:MAG TPA: cytochrome c oxidase subunit II [Microcoleaceae cyanobacterium]
MNIPSSIITMLAGIALTLVSLWYGQNHGLLPAQASEEAPLVDGLFNTMLTIGTGLFLLVQGTLLVAAFRFRRKPGDDTDGPPVEGNIPLEILWTSIPAVIVLGLAVYSFEVYNLMGGLNLNPMDHSVAHGHRTEQTAMVDMKPMPGAAIAATLPDGSNQLTKAGVGKTMENPQSGKSELVVDVAGLQYAWIFTYPDTGVTAGELHVPVGQPVQLNIKANDVLHAFWVPEYRLKQDAIPGRMSELHFIPSKVGEYPVICAELCGPYHGAMKTKVIAQTPEEFTAWIDSQKVASSNGLDQAIALNPTPAKAQTPDQFLAPYVRDLNVLPQTLESLHPAVAHSHMDNRL